MQKQQSKRPVGLYTLLFRRLEEVKRQTKKEIIPFPLLFAKLCPNFSINKQECWDLLFLLRDVGIIQVVPYHGVRLTLKTSQL